jgi:hypothetical protein
MLGGAGRRCGEVLLRRHTQFPREKPTKHYIFICVLIIEELQNDVFLKNYYDFNLF